MAYTDTNTHDLAPPLARGAEAYDRPSWVRTHLAGVALLVAIALTLFCVAVLLRAP